MAKIGLRYPVFKPEGKPAIVIGKAVTANININASSAKQYGDDGLTESDSGFQDGTLELTTTELSQDNAGIMLGHEVVEGELIAKGTDIAPYGVFGFIGVKMVNNTRLYRAILLQKIKFSEPSDENQTKGESLAFGDQTISSDIMLNDKGEWKKEKTFPTLAEAIAYINTAMDITGDEQEAPEEED